MTNHRRITDNQGATMSTDREAELAAAYEHLTAAAAIYQRHAEFVAAHQKTVADAFAAAKELTNVKTETVKVLEQREAEAKRRLRQAQEQLHDYARQIAAGKASLEDLQSAIAKGTAQLTAVRTAVTALRTRHDTILAKRDEHLAWIRSA